MSHLNSASLGVKTAGTEIFVPVHIGLLTCLYLYRPILSCTACRGLRVTKNIESQFATSVIQELIVPSAVDASIADGVDRRRLTCR